MKTERSARWTRLEVKGVDAIVQFASVPAQRSTFNAPGWQLDYVVVLAVDYGEAKKYPATVDDLLTILEHIGSFPNELRPMPDFQNVKLPAFVKGFFQEGLSSIYVGAMSGVIKELPAIDGNWHESSG